MTTISTLAALWYWKRNRILLRQLCCEAGDTVDLHEQSQLKQRLLNVMNKMSIQSMKPCRREDVFRVIAEKTSDTIERYDRNCRRIYANPSLKRLLGDNNVLSMTPMQTHGSSISWMGYQKAIEESIATGREGEYTLCWQTPDNRMRCSHISIVPERDDKGKVHSALAVGRDISSLLASEQHIHDSLDVLRKLLVQQEVNNHAHRKWASWELYDSLGQLLFVQRMDVELLQRSSFSDDAALKAHLEKMLALSDKAIGVMRYVSTKLRPTAFNMGVGLALGWIVEEFHRETNISCELSLTEEEISLDDAYANMLYHILQSALENIVLSADASQVTVILERDNDYYVLQILVDGKGMDLNAPQEGNLGLIYAQELVHAIGGELVLLRLQGEGSLLDVRLPVQRTFE
jgi:signal transduction histidine kinase